MKLAIVSIMVAAVLGTAASANAQRTVIVRPVEIDSVLVNPGMGFNISQHISHRKGPDGTYPITGPDLAGDEYPECTLAYLRFDWRYFEEERGKFNWYLIDRALKLATERGQRLMLRIVPYGNRRDADIPQWLRDEIGPSGELPHGYWRVDHEDPRYIRALTEMAAAVGRRYDGHPDLEFVDIGIVGFWGEGAGSALLSEPTRRKLVDAYLDAFEETQLVMLLTDRRTNSYGVSQRNVGWRVDCLGDLGFWANEQGGWNHMNDYYPQAIYGYGVRDSWKHAPVALEICGRFSTWSEREGYAAADVDYIIDQSLKWHVSSINGKSSVWPKQWQPQLERWLKSLGYRFVLRKFTFPDRVRPHGKLEITTWWENRGVAPIYRQYPLAIRLKGRDGSEVFLTDADITGWLPGDIVYDSAVFLPHGMPGGEYEIQLALLDPHTRKPGIKLAIEGRTADGWYSMGKLTVGETMK
ncbi:MAG: DUF4832 domain-containing protein [Candidatus Glassbacteria bacterium]|nr:DUF4832 domain-containing protein [Candidatus Glassbacteria bacterium]